MTQPSTTTSKNYFIKKYIKNLINKENIPSFSLFYIKNYK